MEAPQDTALSFEICLADASNGCGASSPKSVVAVLLE
jgi:hypothetical protein